MNAETLKMLSKIKDESGSNAKVSILEKEKENKDLKSVLHFLLNPFITTGISKKKIKKNVSWKANVELNSLKDVFLYLEKNKTGRDIDIANVQKYLDSLSLEDRDVVEEIITKSYKLGVTSKTVNKAFGYSFIPTFEVMLAKKYEDEEYQLEFFYVTKKLDGIRCICIKKTNDDIKFYTRKGIEIDGLSHLKEDMIHLPDYYVYDGELIYKEENGVDVLTRFKKTQEVARSKNKDKSDLEFHVFHAIETFRFLNGRDGELSSLRTREFLRHSFEEANDKIESTYLVPILYTGHDKEKIYEIMSDMIESGEEGVMVNDCNAPYQCKRTSSLLKFKEFYTMDLKIVGLQKGEGKYSNTLGSLIVDFKGNTVGVSSGLTDSLRDMIWQDQEDFIGKIIEVGYKDITQDKNGKESLRFPTFKDFREDKKEVSYN